MVISSKLHRFTDYLSSLLRGDEMANNSTYDAHPSRPLNLIGYWASSEEGQDESPEWPDPKDLIGMWNSADSPPGG
jgi:hypothetical protein